MICSKSAQTERFNSVGAVGACAPTELKPDIHALEFGRRTAFDLFEHAHEG